MLLLNISASWVRLFHRTCSTCWRQEAMFEVLKDNFRLSAPTTTIDHFLSHDPWWLWCKDLFHTLRSRSQHTENVDFICLTFLLSWRDKYCCLKKICCFCLGGLYSNSPKEPIFRVRRVPVATGLGHRTVVESPDHHLDLQQSCRLPGHVVGGCSRGSTACSGGRLLPSEALLASRAAWKVYPCLSLFGVPEMMKNITIENNRPFGWVRLRVLIPLELEFARDASYYTCAYGTAIYRFFMMFLLYKS